MRISHELLRMDSDALEGSHVCHPLFSLNSHHHYLEQCWAQGRCFIRSSWMYKPSCLEDTRRMPRSRSAILKSGSLEAQRELWNLLRAGHSQQFWCNWLQVQPGERGLVNDVCLGCPVAGAQSCSPWTGSFLTGTNISNFSLSAIFTGQNFCEHGVSRLTVTRPDIY